MNNIFIILNPNYDIHSQNYDLCQNLDILMRVLFVHFLTKHLFPGRNGLPYPSVFACSNNKLEGIRSRRYNISRVIIATEMHP